MQGLRIVGRNSFVLSLAASTGVWIYRRGTVVTKQIGQDLFEDFIRKRDHSKLGRHDNICLNNQH
jgi:hypothetical protein